ncbi:hypothetical protein CLHUN_01730 [Ruminiclostridium hungatei]|uniref:Uncharacterized protein n=1 Tax=Ruminiclostridium hungatei TaxID=48256 RepID=A0A1V4SSY9_RUMHU|nr:hypothetical protein [Ruminiclostridium hungatei]OPX46357.1 hypothetical protein CLHUN_01730 [Ruminiclostridium hungatei]
MDTNLIIELETLKGRLRKAEEYERTKYMTDTPENRDRAEKAFQEVIKRMDEIWEQLRLVVELNANKTVEQWEQDIRAYAGRFMAPGKIIVYRKSERIFVRLEPPEFWKDPVTKIINE